MFTPRSKQSHMIAPNYKLVRYKPDLKAQVAELQTHLWSPSVSLNAAYLEWKHEKNPYLEEPLIYLAMHDGKAVGMRGFSGVRWELGVPPQEYTGLYADDAVIAPGHRNHGLMPRIMKVAFEDLGKCGHEYIFSLGAGAMTFLTSLSMGWRSAGSVQPMHWRSWQVALPGGLRRLSKCLPLISRKGDAFFARWSASLCRTLADIGENDVRRTLTDGQGITFQDVPRCADMAELVERIGRTARIRHVRSREYFEWCFQNPFSRYRFLFCDTNRLEGYLVLQESISGYAERGVINILDWEATSIAVKAELLRVALKLVGCGRLMIWSATLKPELLNLLEQSSFQLVNPSPGMLQQRPALLVRAIGEQRSGDWLLGGLRLTELANWDLRMLYSMPG